MPTKWAILILFLAGLLAYGNTARNGLFWDDDEFITRNAYIRSFRYLPQWFSQPLTAGAGVNSNYYRPLLMASFTIDYHLWGLWPTGYHMENMLWHTTAAILLFIFLRALFSEKDDPPLRRTVLNINIAFTTALLWLVHPIHVEAVAYANSRGDSMTTVFILLSLILWMKNKTKVSAVIFILALFSKEFAIVTPGLIVLIEFIKAWPFQKRPGLLKVFKRITPHIIIAFIYTLLRLTTLNFQNTLNFYGVDLAKVDQQQPFARYATSLPVRLMTFLRVLPIYGGILIWPNDLHMERTVGITTSTADRTVIIVAAVVIVILLNCYIAIKRKIFLLPFAVGWFFISILPTSGIIPISQILAEHFLYLPSIGFFLLIGWLIVVISNMLAKRLNDSNHLIYWIILLTISIPLLFKTLRQNRVWRDPITFYEYTLAHARPTARVYNNLAMAYVDVKNHDKAIENYQKSIALGDVYPNPHYNLGNTFVETGDTEKAEEEYKKALKIDPNFHYATLKLGQLYLDTNRTSEAKQLVCPVFPQQPLCL